MLVVTRKPGEAIVLTLADGSKVQVLIVAGGPVKVGVNAPESVTIRRAPGVSLTKSANA